MFKRIARKLGNVVRDALPPSAAAEIVDRTLTMVRAEYTVMPRFAFHQPLDYLMDTLPPDFAAPVMVPGEPLPLPPPPERMGYSADDKEYLEWGRHDRDLIAREIETRMPGRGPISLMDFGCSSGRVLRHFYWDQQNNGWLLHGVDVQARPVEWMRQNFPREFCVYTGSTIPHLPFPDSTFDVIYGFSIFTHIKFQWDAWLLELRRVLRPGGLLIQTIHTETAWNYYRSHKNEAWVRERISPIIYESRDMNVDFFYYGDISVSQVFWKKETARKYWGRYFDVLDIKDPPQYSFQDWMICTKPDDSAGRR